MATTQSNSFQFLNAQEDSGVTVLNAVMSDFSYGNHAHEELALGVTLGGVQEFSCNGSRFRSSPGNIILFNPGDVHDGHPGDSDALEYTMLYLDPAEFYPLIGCAAENGKCECRIRETNFDDPILRSLILKMSSLVAREQQSTIEYEHCLYEIAKRFTEREGSFSPDKRTIKRDALFFRVKEYIHCNIGKDISIDDLSGVAHMSKFHFIRLFRKQFGLTPHQYVLNQRINRARASLILGTPPSEVAQNFGFFDASHLNRHFKKAYGVTPKQYQVQLKK